MEKKGEEEKRIKKKRKNTRIGDEYSAAMGKKRGRGDELNIEVETHGK